MDFICEKILFNAYFMFCICGGGIYNIEMEKLSINTSPFSSMSLVCRHFF